jgi:hypothetical protein
LHHERQEVLQPQIIPHFATRLIYSSAGGFNPLSRGLEFTLSPRLIAHFDHVVGGSTTGAGERSLFNTRQEPLSGSYQRLHAICGESLCSHSSAYLKVATTALICAMADAGLEPGSGLLLADPLAAMRTVALDVTCKEPLQMADGNRMTAIEIQRHYLEQAEAHLGAPFMPDWGAEACRRWRKILDMLSGAPRAVEHTLDWGIKLALFARHANNLGIRWDELDCMNQVIERVAAALGARKVSLASNAIQHAIESKRSMQKGVAALEPLLQSRGLGWEDVRILLSCREKLLALDWKFGQIGKFGQNGPNGIFDMLDAAGVLDHRISEEDDIERAMTEPPNSGRAQVRGNVIRRLAGVPNVRCDWQSVVNRAEAKVLDLSDPFTREELWRPANDSEIRYGLPQDPHIGIFPFIRESRNSGRPDPYSQRQEAYSCYQNGNYVRAVELLRGLVAERWELPGTHCHLVRVLLMMDRTDEARQELNLALANRAEAPSCILPRILFLQCLFAMVDGAEFDGIVAQIKRALRAPGAHLDWTIRPLIDHMGPHLRQADAEFLRALADALSDADGVPRLNEFSQWRGATGRRGGRRAHVGD